MMLWRVATLFVAAGFLVLNALPGSAAPPLSVYGQLPGFEDAALSPDGDRVAIVGVLNNQRRLVVHDKSNKLLVAYPLGDMKVRGLYWGGNDNVLVRMSNTADLGLGFTTDKAELSGMIVVPVDGKKPWSVFENKSLITGGISGYYGTIQREGEWFGYFGGITLEQSRVEKYLTTTAPDLYEVNLSTGSAKRVARRLEGDNAYRTWLIDGQGGIAATFDFYSSSSAWRIRDGNGKEIAAGKSPFGGIDLISIGRTAGSVLYYEKDPATGSVRWIEAGAGEPKEILADKAIDYALIDNRTRQLIGYYELGETVGERFFEGRPNKVLEATRKAFPDMIVRLKDWTSDFKRLLVTTEGPGDAGTWWVVDIATGNASQIGSSYPLRSADVGPVRMFKYTAADGLPMEGVLTLPPSVEARSLPVVVLPHGGPTSRDYERFDWWAQAFASRGYAVFQPNFRGSSGYGPAFERAGHGEWGRKMQTDISDGLAELARQNIVDPKRACIVGASYGGFAALAGVTLQQGLYRCAVSVAGVSDVARMVQTDMRESGGDPVLRRALTAQVGSGRDLKLISPANFADKADAPVLLIHGKDDVVVPYVQSTVMLNALKRAGKPVELVTLPDEDHWLSRSATRQMMLEAAVGFVEKHNPAAPAKP